MEDLTKIYLAKSNKADPNLVMKVREKLSKYDIEVVEYSGGTYSDKKLLECEMLVVVPDLSSFEDNDCEAFNVGKVLYQQVEAFSNYNSLSEVFIVFTDNLHVASITLFEKEGYDDYINYGVLYRSDDDNPETLEFHFSRMFNLKKGNQTNYYQLIGNN